jgi:uncharacterized repeat protein (TIGR01451 family)
MIKHNKYTQVAVIFLFLAIIMPSALAATASISQSGADSGTVMKATPFSLTVSDLSGSGQATLQLPSGFSTTEETTKSFSGTSVSWTTITASEKLSSQTISVLISVAGSPSTATTSVFNVVLPPSLSLTSTPSSKTVTTGQVFEISLNVQNTGETTAQSVLAAISLPSGLTTTDSSTQSIGTINGGTGGAGGSSAVSWTITAASPSSSSTITIAVTSSNADTKTVTLPITGPSDENQTIETTDDSGSGGGWIGTSVKTEEFKEGKILFEGRVFETVKFLLMNESHTVKIQAIRADSVDLLIKSTAIKDTIKLSETKVYDLNNNSVNDISIKVHNISGNKANLTIISMLFTPAVVPPPVTLENKSEPAPAEQAPEQPPAPEPQVTPEKKPWYSWFAVNKLVVALILSVIIIVGAIIGYEHYSQKKPKEEEKKESHKEHKK